MFYHKFIQKYGNNSIKIKLINLNGGCKFQLTEKQIKANIKKLNKKLKNENIAIVLCYDADIYLDKSNSLKIKKIISNLRKLKYQVYELKAESEIESWLFHDAEGLNNYFKKMKNTYDCQVKTNFSGKGNLKDLEKLYKLCSKNKCNYNKGKDIKPILEHIRFEKIIEKEYEQFEHILNIIGQ